MGGGQDEGVEERRRFKEGGKNGEEKWKWNEVQKRERREGEKMGPVVVEMSATGAAEMESDG